MISYERMMAIRKVLSDNGVDELTIDKMLLRGEPTWAKMSKLQIKNAAKILSEIKK